MPAKRASVNGDTVREFSDGFGNEYVIISDGMGHGARARVESAMTTSILSRLIRGGAEPIAALKLTNILLRAKSDAEMLSTVDLMCFNRYENTVRLFKMGSSVTFLQSDGIIKEYRSKTLPLGILNEFEADIENFAGSVEEYFHNKNENMSVAGWVFFHLVEHKGDDYSFAFLKETPLYEECGIVCRIPDFWKAKNKTRLSVSIGSKEPSVLGMDAVVAFSSDIYLGDEQFSREEIEKLLSETSGLAYLKGKWVELDKEKLQLVNPNVRNAFWRAPCRRYGIG
jgi:hypothetical protein